MGAGAAAPARRWHNGSFVMVDVNRSGKFRDKQRFLGPLDFGKITGACAALERHNFEYTIMIEENRSSCFEEQYLWPLQGGGDIFPDLDWLTPDSRDVAVFVETHGTKKFFASLLRRDKEGAFEVKFPYDGSVLTGVSKHHLSEPDDNTLRDASPQSLAPDPLWLLDRKIVGEGNIDVKWPIKMRIKEALKQIRVPRPATKQPLLGPFIGKKAKDSEGYPAHPAPLPELSVDRFFVDMWSKYLSKVKFATNYCCGPSHPHMDNWIERCDAADALYFHAALPVFAGLICLGHYQGHPEWVRASDVALVGVALYVDDQLFPGFTDPPLDKMGMQTYGHEACHFIPGCVSTYIADCAWVGAVFCLAPSDDDMEVRDDIYSILAYHQILKEQAREQAKKSKKGQYGPPEITINVNLVLSTNYLANVRTICAGAIKVSLSDRGLVSAYERLRDVQERRLNSQAALYPKRPRKVLSELSETKVAKENVQLNFGQSGQSGHAFRSSALIPGTEPQALLPPPPPPPPSGGPRPPGAPR